VKIGKIMGILGLDFLYYFLGFGAAIVLVDLFLFQSLYKKANRNREEIISILFGNLFWVLSFSGVFVFAIYLAFGTLFCASIIFFHPGKKLLQHSIFALLPFGREPSEFDYVAGLIWNILAVLPITLFHFLWALLLLISIVCIPLASRHVKLVSLSCFPTTTEVVLDFEAEDEWKANKKRSRNIPKSKPNVHIQPTGPSSTGTTTPNTAAVFQQWLSLKYLCILDFLLKIPCHLLSSLL
jgi:uncharacterized membrane protein YccF (DUF307 family)